LALRRKGANTVSGAPPPSTADIPKDTAFWIFQAEMPRERQIASATDRPPCWFGAHRSIQTKRRAMLLIAK
jgi:hypothetical protein